MRPFVRRAALPLALLAAAINPGSVARFDPEFKPPTGDIVDITLEWQANGKTKTARAQDWIRDVKKKESVTFDFVFAGSQEIEHPITKEPYYLGNDGDLVSVANFKIGRAHV